MDKSKNLVWIDLEMTGLCTLSDSIIEIATVVTDQGLNEIAEGPVLADQVDFTGCGTAGQVIEPACLLAVLEAGPGGRAVTRATRRVSARGRHAGAGAAATGGAGAAAGTIGAGAETGA